MASEKRFGYEWDVYTEMDPNHEIQFKRWLGPINRDFIKGKRILDAGCGMGRNSYWALKWGAKEVVAFDNDPRTVASARKTLSSFSNVDVAEKSIYDIEYRNEFDLAFSIGVIHHLADQRLGVEKMIEAVKPGGMVLVWLYGKEGNEKILWFLEPLRKYVTSHLPVGFLYIFTYAFSIPFWIMLKVFRPAGAYYQQLQTFSFHHIHGIIFDQLLPKIAKYYTQDEARELLHGLQNITLTRVNGMSWTVTGIK